MRCYRRNRDASFLSDRHREKIEQDERENDQEAESAFAHQHLHDDIGFDGLGFGRGGLGGGLFRHEDPRDSGVDSCYHSSTWN